MRLSFVSLFENLIGFYFDDSILKRAKQKGLFSIDFINPRDFATNKHKKVDAPKAGGGAGLLIEPHVISDAIKSVQTKESHVIFLLPTAKPFNQKDAKRLAKKEHIVLVSGRYEGIDERVIEKYADEVFSIGDYILTGGELASLVVADSLLRNVEGVLGNSDSLSEESFEDALLEAPSFTKPLEFEGMGIPSEFLKGNHSKIDALKKKMSTYKTQYFRPDMYNKRNG